ncbi:MAG: amidohydrolase family protein [Proteobacteria bacterium]|nr:amidohydrolase family protein [Pseudomonadota bacterium]
MKKSSKTVFKNLNIIDTKNKTIEKNDILVDGGKIIEIGKINAKDAEIKDCTGMFAAPGLVDIHTHLREPGYEYKETIDTASRAAVNGGFVAVAGMANTKPAVDTAGTVRYVLERGKDANLAKIYTYGAVTKNLEGKELAEINDLAKEGVIGLSDDGNTIMDPSLLLRALKYVKMFDLPIVLHEEDINISEEGVMHEGKVQAKLGMAGIPDLAEDTITYRDLRIAEYVDGRVHITHVSAKNTLDVIEYAKDRGVKVTCDVTPHHLLLNDTYIESFNTNYKMKPPLRSEDDRLALVDGIKTGLIDIIATDHAPHAVYEKEVEFNYAPFGVTGLETAFPALYTKLVETGIIDIFKLLELMNKNPVERFKLDIATNIEKGADATFMIFKKEDWIINEGYFKSKSRNNAFLGEKVDVRVLYTLVDGDLKLNNGEIKKGA